MKKYYFIALISTILALSGCEQHRFQDIDTDYRSGLIIYLDANGGNFSDEGDDETASIVVASIDDIYYNNYYWDWDTIPVRSGYYFDGWSQSKNGTDGLSLKKMTFSSPVDTIYAVWKEAKFVSKPFSVSLSKKVYFSAGNLQYHPANNKWRFAPSQLDYIGGANSNIRSSYSGWIDLFGWGTGDNPTKSSSSGNYYYFSDWGNNKINNEAPNTWRTLTYDEWNYLFEGRQNSHSLYGTATVNNVHGLIILPDDWNEPNLSFTSGTKGWENNVYSTAEWKELEYEGAVFLPAAGYRGGSFVGYVQDYGYYWSATEYNRFLAPYLGFLSDGASMSYYDRYNGSSVRLVKDLQ